MATDPKELLKLHEPKKLKQSFESGNQQHNGARYSPCGKYLIAGGYTGQVLRWQVEGDEFKPLDPLAGHGGWVQAVAFAPKDEIVFTGDSWGRLRATPYASEQPKPKWDIAAAHSAWLRDVAVSPDGKQLATCGADQIVRLWDAATGKKLHELLGHNEDVFRILWHPDGKSLVSGDHKGVVKQWDVASAKATRSFDASVLFTVNRLQDVGGVRAMGFDRDGKTLLIGGTQPANGGNVQGVPTLLAFDWASGKQTKKLELGASSDVYVSDLRCDDRGFIMIAQSGNPGAGKLLFLRLEDEKPFFELKLSNCHVISLHPGGTRLAVTTTNANSAGNGRVKGKGEMDYPGNWSPVVLFDLPAAV